VLRVVCERVDGGWRSISDSNGYGWTGFLRDDFAVGVMTLWGEAPPRRARSQSLAGRDRRYGRDLRSVPIRPVGRSRRAVERRAPN